MTYLAFAARGRTAAWRYLLTIVLALVMAMLMGALLMGVLMFAHAAPADLAAQLQNPGNPKVFFPGTGISFLLVLAGFVLAARWVQNKRLGDLTGAWNWRLVGAGAGIWAVALVLLTAVDLAIAPGGFTVTASRQTFGLALLALVALIPQTFAEELIFRGVITQGLFLALKRPAVTAAISGLIFGSVHIPNGWPQAAAAAVFGFTTALMAIRLGGIAFTFGVHLANNLFGAVVVVSRGDVFNGVTGLFSQNTPQLMWWDVVTASAGLLLLTWMVSRFFLAESARKQAE